MRALFLVVARVKVDVALVVGLAVGVGFGIGAVVEGGLCGVAR